MTIYLGVDPGFTSGAVVALNENGSTVGAWRLSKHTHNEISEALGHIFEPVAAVEKVASMPGQGVSSTFKFGYGTGLLTGLLIAKGIQFEQVTPQKWQKGLLPKGLDKPERKRHLKGIAQQRHPDQSIVNEDADAWLIADWARTQGMWAVNAG